MLLRDVTRAGILFVLIASATFSCGERTPTEPDPSSRVIAVPVSERYENSPQRELRELLIDGRATDIEWNIAGTPTVVLLKGSRAGGGGDYYISIRALWSFDAVSGDSVALYLLVQWADPFPDRLELPLVTSVDMADEDGNPLVDCATNDALVRPSSWTRSSIREDQILVDVFSTENEGYPADRWRWGAGTTDPISPVNGTEFQGANNTGDTLGQTKHPAAGVVDDFFNNGSGWIGDETSTGPHPSFYEENFQPGSFVPKFIADKGTRDTRLNRGKPVAYTIWRYVAKPLTACEGINPVRVDDTSLRDKTWNPGDYVPSFVLGFPDSALHYSLLDVIARASWEGGKWSLELRRLLEPRVPDVSGVRSPPRPDDVVLLPGRTYGLRITVFNASKTVGSASAVIPLYIKPRS
jgi:hypothetical protein